MDKIITLEKWALVYDQVDAYTPPELITTILTGFQEMGGALKRININQSEIQHYENGIILTSKGKFKFGEVDSEYEKLYPDAKERTIKQLFSHFLKKEQEEEYEIIKVPKQFIPKNAKLVEAYENENEIVVVGEIDSENEEHNCDQMGCSTLSHVKYRFKKETNSR